MRLLLVCMIWGGVCVSPAQQFVCGTAAGKTELGAIHLESTSLYAATSAGFELNGSPAVKDGFCTGDKPFFFSVPLAEGSYRVTIRFGSSRASVTTVRAEARRLMLERVSTAPGTILSRSFDVNLREPQIGGDANRLVKLKAREVGNLDWDDKLTLEFNGDQPSFHSVSIEAVKEPTVYLAGDSTVVDQDVEPWAAWGQMLPRFFSPGVVIANHAESGETIRSFIGEQRYAKVMSLIQPGDYLFIQFGHNDQKPGAVSLDEYKVLLAGYIADARAKGATPVLVTSMNRRTFDAAGKITNSLSPFTEAVREVAAEQNAVLIDLNAMSKTLFEAMGPELSMKAFMHYPANAFPNQTEAISDDTHFNNYGAYELARCMAHGIRASMLPLKRYLLTDLPDFDAAHPDAQSTFNLPVTPIPAKTANVMKVPQI